MKALLILFSALAAGRGPAQSLLPDPWSLAEPLARPPGEIFVMRPRDAYEIRRPRYTLDGLSVEIYKAQNPLDLFNPFDQDTLAAAHDNVVWDPKNGRAIGWNFFSFRF